MQVKQLRNRADEDARLVHMSLQMDSELPSSLRKDLDHLMILVSGLFVFLHIHIYIRGSITSNLLLLIDENFWFVFSDRGVLQQGPIWIRAGFGVLVSHGVSSTQLPAGFLSGNGPAKTST